MIRLKNLPVVCRRGLHETRLAWRCRIAPGKVERPVFIVGCGRSGTTILGKCLSLHPDITYLNEPRDLWRHALVTTDYISYRAWRDGTYKLDMYAADATVRSGPRLHALFAHEVRRHGGRQLIEKTPINSLRMDLVKALFPDCIFIHICRHPLEVANSIAVQTERGLWWGSHDIKKHQIKRYAETVWKLGDVVSSCTTDRDFALIEWRVYTSAVREAFAAMPSSRYLEISYDDLLDDAGGTIHRLLSFMDLPDHEDTLAYARSEVKRRTRALGATDCTARERFLAGPLLDALFPSTVGR